VAAATVVGAVTFCPLLLRSLGRVEGKWPGSNLVDLVGDASSLTKTPSAPSLRTIPN
jgi:hypothetical protein